jgi:GAF domain-containing protein
MRPRGFWGASEPASSCGSGITIELIACPALGMNGGSLRLPDTAGIVGEVVQTGKPIRVDDAYRDPRFDKSVDLANGFTTRNLLCQPLRDIEGNLIGAFEALNRIDGPFTDDDVETLVQLGVPAAIALENAREREQMTRSIEQLTEQVTQGVHRSSAKARPSSRFARRSFVSPRRTFPS